MRALFKMTTRLHVRLSMLFCGLTPSPQNGWTPNRGSHGRCRLWLASAKLHNLTINLKDSTLASKQLTVSEDDRNVLVSVTIGMKRTPVRIWPELRAGNWRLLKRGRRELARRTKMHRHKSE